MRAIGFLFPVFAKAFTLRVSAGLIGGLLVCSGAASAQTPS